MWPSLETTPKTITVAVDFVFITLGTLNRLDLHFEGAGNGPVVITWIGREHDLYSGASPISLVEHYVTFRQDRRLLSLLGFVHSWPTNRWSSTKKKKRRKKRKPVFIKRKWNHVVFSWTTILSFRAEGLVNRIRSYVIFRDTLSKWTSRFIHYICLSS